MGELFQFKRKPLTKIGYVISLYTEEEIQLCIVALNRYNFSRFKAREDNISHFDPQMIILCLTKMIYDEMYSKDTKDLAKKILSRVQEVAIPYGMISG